MTYHFFWYKNDDIMLILNVIDERMTK